MIAQASGVARAIRAVLGDCFRGTPYLTRMEEVLATWRRVTAPVLWIGAEDSFVLKWLAGTNNERPDIEAELSRRMAAFSNCKLVMVPDAGHMLHHDQPRAVASAIEAFLQT